MFGEDIYTIRWVPTKPSSCLILKIDIIDHPFSRSILKGKKANPKHNKYRLRTPPKPLCSYHSISRRDSCGVALIFLPE